MIGGSYLVCHGMDVSADRSGLKETVKLSLNF